MATFAGKADVESLNPHRVYTSDSKPTETQLEGILDFANRKVSAELIQVGLPVDTDQFTKAQHPELWVLLANYAAHIAAARAEQTALAGGNVETEHLKALRKDRDKARKDLFSADLAQYAPSSYADLPWSNEVDDPNPPRITMDQRF
jgi:hypothetical protein